jgi:ERCC4-related helicase
MKALSRIGSEITASPLRICQRSGPSGSPEKGYVVVQFKNDLDRHMTPESQPYN